jgi:hypothetical protein
MGERLEFGAAVCLGRKNSYPGRVIWVYTATVILFDKATAIMGVDNMYLF